MCRVEFIYNSSFWKKNEETVPLLTVPLLAHLQGGKKKEYSVNGREARGEPTQQFFAPIRKAEETLPPRSTLNMRRYSSGLKELCTFVLTTEASSFCLWFSMSSPCFSSFASGPPFDPPYVQWIESRLYAGPRGYVSASPRMFPWSWPLCARHDRTFALAHGLLSLEIIYNASIRHLQQSSSRVSQGQTNGGTSASRSQIREILAERGP